MKCRTSYWFIQIHNAVYIWSLRTLRHLITGNSITIASYIQRIWVLWNACLHNDFTLCVILIICLDYVGAYMWLFEQSCNQVIRQKDTQIFILTHKDVKPQNCLEGQKCFAIKNDISVLFAAISNIHCWWTFISVGKNNVMESDFYKSVVQWWYFVPKES